MFVQFSDSNETEIIAYFTEPQIPLYFPNQGEVEITDPRWVVFYEKIHASSDGVSVSIGPVMTINIDEQK
ncbi:hypothetical protein [Yersinia enterocolitica]|uniref:hypothetical protein n=1 Tax=Yersinia enterocolitica TaxID=630 RepID=UPI003D79C9DC